MKTDSTLSTSNYKIQSIDRAVAILDLIAEAPHPVTLSYVSDALDLHKSTAHRFLVTLLRHRLISRTNYGRYKLGLKLNELADVFDKQKFRRVS